MQIIVQSAASCFAVSLNQESTVADLKVAIEDQEFLPAGVQRIVKGGLALADNSSLYEVVGDMETVELIIDVTGGMRAKWRKKRMRRLRRKRRKMRQRAR